MHPKSQQSMLSSGASRVEGFGFLTPQLPLCQKLVRTFEPEKTLSTAPSRIRKMCSNHVEEWHFCTSWIVWVMSVEGSFACAELHGLASEG